MCDLGSSLQHSGRGKGWKPLHKKEREKKPSEVQKRTRKPWVINVVALLARVDRQPPPPTSNKATGLAVSSTIASCSKIMYHHITCDM